MIRALISDLGNVLLHFDHRIIEQRLSSLYPAVLHDNASGKMFWNIVHDFEIGVVNTSDFLRQMGLLLHSGQSLDRKAFFEIWGDIFWLNEPYLEVLRNISEHLELVLLSNTNPLHISFAQERFPEVFTVFRKAVYSFDCGFAKPDARIFQLALNTAGVLPDEVLYVDDIASYIDAAVSLGLHGYQYISVDALIDILHIYEIYSGRPPASMETSGH